MTARASATSRLRLWIEFLALFIGVPILMTLFIEDLQRQRLLFSLIWILAGVSAILLWRTPGWEFSKLWKGPVLGKWPLILIYWIVTAATCTAFVLVLVPERFLAMPLYRPELWLLIMIAYPIASAWPQEVIFRSLFFERYESLFPGKWSLIAANGAVFGFGHLFYDSWVTIAMTGVGGAIIGWAYLTQGRSMLLAWVLHALAGQLIFTSGLGIYFYSGAIGQ